MANGDEGDRALVSYLTLRRVVGVLGVLLPVLVAVGCVLFGTCVGILDSISAYYGTDMRDVFVGVLFAIAWFLFAYRGYERKDDLAGDVACVSALGVALFPVTSSSDPIQVLHFLSAAVFLCTLAYFSLFLFTKTDPTRTPTPQKKIRNRVYVVCGILILVSIALIPVYYLFLTDSPLSAFKPVWWLESVALWAFGISWFVKGETLWRDSA